MLRCSAIDCKKLAEFRVIWEPPKTGCREVIHLCKSCLDSLQKSIFLFGLEIIQVEPIPQQGGGS